MDKVQEDPNEHLIENEDSQSSKSKKVKEEDRKDSFVVKVNMNNLDNSSNIGVKIAINEVSSLTNPQNTESNQSNLDEKEKSLNSNQLNTPSNKEENPNEEEEEKKLYELDINKDENVSNSNSENEEEESESESQSISKSKSAIELRESQFETIEKYYSELRKNYGPNNQWEDPDFGPEKNSYFTEKDENNDVELERLTFDDDKVNFFIYENSSHNIDYEFKIKNGILRDKFFLGAFLMLFRRREEYFQNLILDIDHIKDNINSGFCGFTFFIDGEWKNITVDTRLPKHQNDEFSLSNTETPNAYWMCLFEKAYAKAFGTYGVLDMIGVTDFLVDLTGGYARLKEFVAGKDSGFDESKKKALFEEIQKALNQKYLIGCMKFDASKVDEEPDSDQSDDGAEDEAIATNCMHNILDAQEDNGTRLIYLVNYWPKGKWTGTYSVEDETWEANKALAERLNYQVSQSDGTFWMDFDDWLTYFNRVYYCRIFPETWAQFVIPGKWSSITSGGAPPKNTPWYPERYHPPQATTNQFAGATSIKPDKINTNFASPGMNITGTSKKKTIMNPMGASPSIRPNLMMKNQMLSNKGTTFMPLSGKINMLSSPTMIGSLSKPSIKPMNSTSSGFKKTPTKKTNNNNANVEPKKKAPAVVKKKIPPKIIHSTIKRNIITDTEDRWFLNPQYKIEIGPNTRMIISLMQKDKKLEDDNYLKCQFFLIYCKGKYSRVWDIDEDKIIKKSNNDLEKSNREIIVQLDYNEALRIINSNRKKKLQKGELLHINLIPFIDYTEKYEVNKYAKTTIQFMTHAIESVFWLRVFASNDIYIAELNKPFECTANSAWTHEKEMTSGGARYLTEKGRTLENSKWAINPQFLITFEKNIQMKIILKKTKGHFSIEENKIGFMLCKPEPRKEEVLSIKQKTQTNFNKTLPMFMKTEQIFRVMESTARILDNRQNNIADVFPKMFINGSEWTAESSYCNSYCACLNMTFNKIDSPIILIPTLDTPNNPFEFELKVYSNRPTSVFSLNNSQSKLLLGEWGEDSCGGSHLAKEEKKKKKKDDNAFETYKKELEWFDNPKYHLSFKSENEIPKVEFEVILTRTDSIWKPIISRGVVNSMIGIYVFEFTEGDIWKKKCVNFDSVEFLPQNRIILEFEFEKVDPKGFIIMPVTYGSGVKGPFLIMVKCKEKFTFTQIEK